jgi:hypothetical protein
MLPRPLFRRPLRRILHDHVFASFSGVLAPPEGYLRTFIFEPERRILHNATALPAPPRARVPVGWNRASTSVFEVTDPQAFRSFLSQQPVQFVDCRGKFLLLADDIDYWPGEDPDGFLFLGLDHDEFEADELEDRLRCLERRELFWRDVRSHMPLGTYLVIMDVGFFGFAPFVFGRQLSHGARAIAMHQDGRLISIELEDVVAATILEEGWTCLPNSSVR